jgi:hypothetical protein
MRRTLFIVTMLLLFTACERVTSATQPKQPATPDARSLDLRNPDQASAILVGDVLIQSIRGTNAVVVALDGGSRPGLSDGVADQVFVLQREGTGDSEGRMKLSGARMLYEGKSLLIRPRDGSPALALTLNATAPLTERARVFLGRTAVRDRWAGYGLSRRTGHWQLHGAFFAPNEVANLIPACRRSSVRTAGAPVRSFGLDNICDSGGVGSSGCSTGCISGRSCSTSCTAGYHSCCDRGACSCTCVAN